jgi:hypothetical protein
MFPQIRWLPSFATTCMHAAAGVARGWEFADPRLVAAREPCAALQATIHALALPESRIWRLLCANAVDFDSSRPLAEVALKKGVGAGALADRSLGPLSAAIAGVQSAVGAAIPNLTEELALRIRPLQEQWEARGPGLMRSIARLTDERLIVEAADIILVHPVFGGSGDAHLQRNSIRLEAVLTNPHPELPEVVRIAWLLAQLQCDLPAFSEAFSAEQLPRVAKLALLPPVLAAAEDLELVRNSPELMTKAMEAWRIEPAPAVNFGSTLLAWWETVIDSRPNWTVALTGLERLMAIQGVSNELRGTMN